MPVEQLKGANGSRSFRPTSRLVALPFTPVELKAKALLTFAKIALQGSMYPNCIYFGPIVVPI